MAQAGEQSVLFHNYTVIFKIYLTILIKRRKKEHTMEYSHQDAGFPAGGSAINSGANHALTGIPGTSHGVSQKAPEEPSNNV